VRGVCRVVVTISIAGALMLQWDTSVYLGLLSLGRTNTSTAVACWGQATMGYETDLAHGHPYSHAVPMKHDHVAIGQGI